MSGYADFEPLLSDGRVNGIASRLFDEYRPKGLPDDVDFLTFIQPPTIVDRNGVKLPIPSVACFAIITDNPRDPDHRIMTQASVWLQDWRAKDALRRHYVAGPEDPAFPIFKRLVIEQLQKLQSLKELI